MESLLRPNEVDLIKEEKRRLENMLGNTSPHVAGVVNRNDLMRQLQQANHQLKTQSPNPLPTEEKDAAVKLEESYRESILTGMPTQAEMRRNPAGAVDKHRSWEKRSKETVGKWKNLRLRMHATGMISDLEDAQDIANFELYRPVGGAQEMNMDNCQIDGQNYFFPANIQPKNIMSDEDRAKADENSVMAILQRQADGGDVQARRLLTSVTRQAAKEA